MIGRLTRGAFGLMLYFALGTLIAEGIMLWYLQSSGRLDDEKFSEVLGVLQGVAPAASKPAEEVKKTKAAPEPIPYEQVLEARAVKDKNLELRELALASASAQVKASERQLADAESRYKRQVADFKTQLDSMAKSAKSGGQDEVQRILESIKPKQAKEFIMGMLDNKEEDAVVLLLQGMSDSKRAKVLGEFKTADETKKIEDVLRRIRQGVPQAPLADRAKEQLRPPGTAGS